MAFSARKSSLLVRSSRSSALHAGVVWDDAVAGDLAADGAVSMSRAEACVNSDSCGLVEAQAFLDDVLRVQKECVGSGVLSTNSAICDDVGAAAEIVAGLRVKIEAERRRLAPLESTKHLVGAMLSISAVTAILHVFAASPDIPVEINGGEGGLGIVPFLPREWFWALRDGYLPLLFGEWIKNGGLVVDVSAFGEKAVPFTPQEWFWSVRDGGFDALLRESVRHGGLVVDSRFDTETIPMSPEDVLLSVNGGYLGTAANHFFRKDRKSVV